MTLSHASRVRQVVATTIGLGVGGLAFFLTLLNYGTDLGRTAVAGGFLGNFFDLQGRQFLDGRLSFDDGALGIEGFVHEGKTYTYFPPFPALLRMPILMTTREFDGRLTLLSMAVAWIVFAVICTKLVWLVTSHFTPGEISRRTAVVAAAFLAAATGGSYLTFDAALPWTYHEVYVWAVTGATGALYWLIRTLLDEQDSSALWLFWFTLVAIGSRATEGWAVCLVVIAVALLFRFRPRTARQRAMWWKVLLAGAVPLALSIALNIAKFDAIYMFPLQTQVWTEVSPQRRAALAANGGSLTGPQFFTTSFMAYLRPDGIRFTEWFPFITLPASPPPAYHGAFVDQAYRTGSATAFMPLFMLGFLVSVVAAFRPRAGEQVRLFRAPLIASVLMTGGVMAYGYYSNRYVSDFMPAMVLGGAVGAGLLVRWLSTREPRRTAVPVLGLVAGAAAFSVLAQMATGATIAATMARGAPLERYLGWQQQLSPSPPPVRVVDGFPTGGSTDDLALTEDCSVLYLNVGDQYEPWITVLERDHVVVLERSGRLRDGETDLLTVTGDGRTTVRIETDRAQRVRLVADDGKNEQVGGWIDLGPTSEGTVRVGVRHLTGPGFYQVTTIPGGLLTWLPSRYLDAQVDTRPSTLAISEELRDLSDLGLEAQVSRGPADPLCLDIADDAGIPVADR